MIRVIKRFADRRLYDTTAREYINLTKLLSLKADGANLLIIDNQSKRDITNEVIAKAELRKVLA